MKRFPSKHPESAFWLIFFLVNLLFFLPFYLSFASHSTFLPSSSLPEGELSGRFRFLFYRDNRDVFRLCGEWTLFAMLMLVFRHSHSLRKRLVVFGSIVFTFLFYYHVYYSIMRSLYANHPYLPGDLVLAYQVLPQFMEVVDADGIFTYLAIALLAIGSAWAIHIAIKYLEDCARMLSTPKASFFIGASLVVFLLAGGIRYHASHWYRADYMTGHWMFHKLYFSFFQPRSQPFSNEGELKTYASYTDHPLREKPDIYFICIESYGKVLMTAPEFTGAFERISREFEMNLESKGYHIASTTSLSPIAGGKSWLAFTSLLTGTRVSNQQQYLDLQKFHYTYPHMVRYLNSQGYQTTRMKTLMETSKVSKMDYDYANRFFAFNQFIRQPDFPYKGYVYNFFGGIPDQYALGFYRDKVPKDLSKPQFMFFITMDSHGPWFIPAPILKDWKDLDTIQHHPDARVPKDASLSDRSKMLVGSMEDRYPKTIEHELHVISDFIDNNLERPDVYILIGDHQPALISNYDHDGLETMVHIISKDLEFVDSFVQLGFKKGMILPGDETQRIKHEGFYSLFIQQLVKTYGKKPSHYPPYIPGGI